MKTVKFLAAKFRVELVAVLALSFSFGLILILGSIAQASPLSQTTPGAGVTPGATLGNGASTAVTTIQVVATAIPNSGGASTPLATVNPVTNSQQVQTTKDNGFPWWLLLLPLLLLVGLLFFLATRRRRPEAVVGTYQAPQPRSGPATTSRVEPTTPTSSSKGVVGTYDAPEDPKMPPKK